MARRQFSDLKALETIPLAIESKVDSVSGRTVERLTDNTADTLVTYFTREMMTPDNRGVLVASNRAGEWLPYLIYPDEKIMRCVCTTSLHTWSSPAIGGDRVVYVSHDGRLGYVPIEGGEFQAITELPRDMHYSEVTVSSCGRFAVLFYSEKSPSPSRRIADGSFPSSGSEKMAFRPRAVMLHVDLDTGLGKGLTGAADGGCHPLISPADPEWMEYCTSAPWRLDQRMYAVRYCLEAFYIEVRPLFRQKLGIDAVGHEFFLQDGRIAAVWMKFGKVTDPADSPRQSFILVVDPRNGKFKAYKTPGFIYNHLHGRDGRVFVSEGRSDLHATKRRGANPKKLDLLCRYDVKGDKTVATALCAHGCSWNGQLAHPHAVLCRESRSCYFNSDKDGRTNVYRVRLDR